MIEFAAKLQRQAVPKKFAYRGVQPLFEGTEFSRQRQRDRDGMETVDRQREGQPTMKGTSDVVKDITLDTSIVIASEAKQSRILSTRIVWIASSLRSSQ